MENMHNHVLSSPADTSPTAAQQRDLTSNEDHSNTPQYSNPGGGVNRRESYAASIATLPPAYTPNPGAENLTIDSDLNSIAGKQSSWYHGIRYTVDDLWKAALQGHTSALQKCLKAGLNVNYCRWVQDRIVGHTVRSIADIIASRGDVRSMRLLLEHNADLIGTVVSVFASNGRFGTRKSFVTGDVQGLEDDLWTTPLHEACKHGQLDMIAVLLDECKVNPHTMDSRQRTCLFIATKSKQTSVVQRLLLSGVAIESGKAGDITPLASAAFSGSLDIVDLLLQSGANPDIADYRGETALYNASLVGNHDIVTKLVTYGADIDARNLADVSAFFTAASNFKADTMTSLIECGADIDTHDANGCTPLLRAVMAKNIVLVKYLLGLGADIDSPDERGWTPLFAAMIHGDEILIRLLLDAGCDISEPDLHGNTPLHQAAMLNSNMVVRHILTQRHATTLNLSQVNAFDETPLTLACKYNHSAIVKILLKHGADPKFIDNGGFTALDRAMYHQTYACVRQLVGAGASINDNALRSLETGHIRALNSRQNAPSSNYDMIVRMLKDRYHITASTIPKDPSSLPPPPPPSPPHRSFALAITLTELRARMRVKQRKPTALNPETGSVLNQAAPPRDGDYSSDPFEACIPTVPNVPLAQVMDPTSSGVATGAASAARLGMGATSLALNVASLSMGA